MPASGRAILERLNAISRKGFVRDERGVTLIEFALLAVPFFVLVGAMIETSLIFFAGQVLDSAVGDASRLIRTGQAQASSIGSSGFRTQVCDKLFGLFNCNDLKIKVSTITDFNSASTALDLQPIDPNDGSWKFTETYQPGAGSSIVMVQAFYKWPALFDFAGLNLADQPDGSRLLGSVRVFRNEPF
ncbi:MAG TPA: TadE/TadG family type IV pilus assembly protein [Devosiaceae bacterium]